MLGSAPQWTCPLTHRFVNVLARSSIVICNEVSEDRIGTDNSGVILATFLRVVLLCFATQSLQIAVEFFAAGHRKSYWNGCIKAAIAICREIFSIFRGLCGARARKKMLRRLQRSDITCLPFQESEGLKAWKFGCLRVWRPESLNVWKSADLKVLNVWKSECRQSTYMPIGTVLAPLYRL